MGLSIRGEGEIWSGFRFYFMGEIAILHTSSFCAKKQYSIPPFQLHRGTRQGCPLSPLLFAIAIEPLAIWLRSENGFEGVSRQGSLHKLSLYADDLLLYVSPSHPSTSLPIVLDILKQFGQLSGYKLNFGKSELFAINNLVGVLARQHSSLKRVDDCFKYLGILITRSLTDTFNKNVVPCLAE